MCVLTPHGDCWLPINFVLLALWSISAPADGWILINAFREEGMSILKMIHNGFEDLQISLDLEAFRNLPQLQAETETFPSQSTIHFSLYSLLYF